MIAPAAFALLCLCTQVPSCKLGLLPASISKDGHICRDKIAERLDVGRWVFLLVVIIDFVGLALAMMMRNMSDNPYRYTEPSDALPRKAATHAPPASCLAANSIARLWVSWQLHVCQQHYLRALGQSWPCSPFPYEECNNNPASSAQLCAGMTLRILSWASQTELAVSLPPSATGPPMTTRPARKLSPCR